MNDKLTVYCPWCGELMMPQRESKGMIKGIDYLLCSNCFARSPEILTTDGNWDGKQKLAYLAAMKRVDTNKNNLCNSCKHEYSGCPNTITTVRGGKGNGVIACKSWEKIILYNELPNHVLTLSELKNWDKQLPPYVWVERAKFDRHTERRLVRHYHRNCMDG